MSEQTAQESAKAAGQQTSGAAPALGSRVCVGDYYVGSRQEHRLCLKWEEEGKDGLKG